MSISFELFAPCKIAKIATPQIVFCQLRIQGAGPLCPKSFLIVQFSGNFKGKPPILSKFWVQGPPPLLG